MSTLNQAVQLSNLQSKIGISLDELADIVKRTGLSEHGQIRSMFQREFELGYSDANTLVHILLKSDGTRAAEGKSTGDVIDEIYSGPKAALRPIHDKLMKEITRFGEFKIAPKKGYVSLRRKRQFAMIGPTTNTRVEVGLNAKDLKKNARLLERPKGSMCNYIVRVTNAGEVDRELFAWIKSAFEGAG